jgi:hypothetical protein
MYRLGTHGPWCHTRIFRVTCRDCGETIYLFSCDCGSSVRFDQPEYPWVKHLCGGQGIPEKAILHKAPIGTKSFAGFGLVKQVDKAIDILSKYKLTESTGVALKLLEEILKQRIDQVMIYADNFEDNKRYVYSFYIPKDQRKLQTPRVGDTIRVDLVSRSILGRIEYWICRSLQIVSTGSQRMEPNKSLEQSP